MIHRRSLIAAGGLALASPRLGLAAVDRTMRFAPYSDVASLDPVWTTINSTRTHGYLVYDTLYGWDAQYRPQPQMVEGHVVEDDGRRWTLKLREGLRFHDGEPVRGRDVVASIRRWAARDTFGQALFAVVDSFEAPTDRTVVFRLRRPFPLLPVVLGKASTPMPCIMPERLALTDPSRQVTEAIGSGPYRFLPEERVPGAFLAYERFAGYVPRPDGEISFTAGPKVAHMDRVELRVIPDPATQASALRAGEIDWLEQVIADLRPFLSRDRNVRLEVLDPNGQIGIMRFNQLQPPFDNPAIRRAILGAINQRDFMTASAGEDPAMWRAGVGAFCPDTPMANDVGIEALTSPRNPARVRAALAEAGYRGEPIVLLDAANNATTHPLAAVASQMFGDIGMNVDTQSLDQVVVVQRRNSRAPVSEGGWSVLVTYFTGPDMFTPATHQVLRGNGADAWYGWPTAPRIEQLRDAWLETGDEGEQKRICGELQRQLWEDVPYIPLGQAKGMTGYRRNVSGVLSGFPLFWNVRKN
ncbi:MAG: transporter substrate-binding protein [Rubritepida sp.]|nr:transporter substrate-binding protein [Rubritepida sp.]